MIGIFFIIIPETRPELITILFGQYYVLCLRAKHYLTVRLLVFPSEKYWGSQTLSEMEHPVIRE